MRVLDQLFAPSGCLGKCCLEKLARPLNGMVNEVGKTLQCAQGDSLLRGVLGIAVWLRQVRNYYL